MKKSRIYTKTGDKGETGLVSGTRVSKADARLDLYGALDGFNSQLGFALSLISSDKTYEKISTFLFEVQSVVFDLGSNLACEAGARATYKLPKIPEAFVVSLETEIDALDSALPPLKNFILPGGSTAAAAFHLSRTSAREVERKLVAFREKSQEELPENSLEFLNRLSDYLFVLARYVNKLQGSQEREWIPVK